MPLLAAGSAFSTDDATILLLSLGVLLGLAKLLGEWARLLRQPAVLGEILAGVLLGPTVLGAMAPESYATLFPTDGAVPIALEGFVILAVLLLLLVAGLEVDLSSVWRQGRVAILVSATGIAFPFALGFALAWLAPRLLGLGEGGDPLPFALFVGVALSITALPVIAKILMDLNMSKSDLGVLVLSSAMVNDLLGWIGFAMILAMLPDNGLTPGTASEGSSGIVSTIVLTFVFLGVMLTLGRWLAHRVLPYLQAHFSWPGGVLVFIMVVAIVSGAFTEYIGVHSIFGAFIAGVAIGDSRHLRESTRDTIHKFVMNIFAPVFFATIGLRVNFVEAFDFWLVLVVILVACLGKIGGCFLGARMGGMGSRESWAVGFGMVARGAMEIILAQLARSAGLISDELFVAIVIMALVTSLISGPAIERLMQRKIKRRLADVLSERQFVSAVRADDVAGAIRELSETAGELTDLPASKIFEAVWAREQIMHTGLGQSLAVPHARLPELERSLVIVGRSEHGIDFDAADGKPAQLICLLLTPADNQAAQIELLDMVARAFANPSVRRDVIEAKTFTEVLAAFSLGHTDSEPAENH